MTARLPDPAGSRAVVIGVSDYADSALPRLPAVLNNAVDLCSLLTSPAATALATDHCTPVVNPPDPVTVSRALRRAARAATDLLLVYYSGHGLLSSEHGELYLATSGTDRAEIGTTALRCDEVRAIFRDSMARNRVLIVDCCFAGRVLRPTMADHADIVRTAFDDEIGGVYVLTATEPNQVAVAPENQRHTAFTGELLNVLRHGLPGQDELITLDMLYRALRLSLARQGQPGPSCVSEKTTAHLGLARNAALAGRSTAEIAVRASVEELADLEAQATRARARALDRISAPGPIPVVAKAASVRARLDGSATPTEAELAEISGQVADAIRCARDALELAVGPIRQRDDLRGRVSAYDALAVRLGIAERIDVVAAKRAATALLWTKPCDLVAAADATAHYVRCVADAEPAARAGGPGKESG